jgi:hypothetical protein
LRLGGGQFDRRKGIPFIRVELVVVLGELERIERVVPECSIKRGDASPLFRIRKVRGELIDEARTLLKPECFVPQVSVEQSHHRLTDVAEAKDENVSRFFPGSPKHRYEHFAVAVRRGLNYWRAVLLDLFPKTIERSPVTRFEPLMQSLKTRTQGLVVNVSSGFLSNERVLAIVGVMSAHS